MSIDISSDLSAFDDLFNSSTVVDLKDKIVRENFTSFQLVRASDGTRTDVVVLPFQQLLTVLEQVDNKKDFVLVLHQADFLQFSLYPLITVENFLKLNKVEGI